MRSPTIPLETKRSQAALVIGTGVALGVLVLAGQRWLPDVANQAANVGAPWLLVAFALGSVLPTPRAALLGGLVGLLVALASYYVAARLALGEAGIATAGIMAFWGGVALVGGPTFGLAGHWWRAGAGARGSRGERAARRSLHRRGGLPGPRGVDPGDRLGRDRGRRDAAVRARTFHGRPQASGGLDAADDDRRRRRLSAAFNWLIGALG